MVEGMVVGRGGTVGGTVLAVLAERGPLELGELARLVAERGATRAKRPEVSVRRAAGREPRVVSLLDGRWVSVPAVLEGVVLTHRLDQDEADGEMLPIDPDLASLAPLAIAGLRLVAGGDLELCSDAHLHGPSGWLGGLGARSRSALHGSRPRWRISASAGCWRWWSVSCPSWARRAREGWRRRCRWRWWCCRRWWRRRGCCAGPRCRLVSC